MAGVCGGPSVISLVRLARLDGFSELGGRVRGGDDSQTSLGPSVGKGPTGVHTHIHTDIHTDVKMAGRQLYSPYPFSPNRDLG